MRTITSIRRNKNKCDYWLLVGSFITIIWENYNRKFMFGLNRERGDAASGDYLDVSCI